MKRTILISAPRISGQGGTETVIEQWVNSSLSDDFNFILFISQIKDRTWLNRLPNEVKIINGHKNRMIRIIIYIYILLTQPIDIILDTNTKTLKLDWVVRKFFRCHYKIYSWLHFSLHHVKSININYLQYADKHLAISSGIAKQLYKITPNIPIYTIYNPIAKSQESYQRSEGLCKHFVYIGRIDWNHQKNLKFLFEEFSKIDANQYCLHIYGDGNDLAFCKNKAKELNLNIHFYGWKQDPWTDIDHPIDYLVLTSKFEGFPMIIGESLSRGIPVISSRCPTGPEDLIIPGVNGFLFNIDNSEEFQNIICDVLSDCIIWNTNKIRETINPYLEQQYFKDVEKVL